MLTHLSNAVSCILLNTPCSSQIEEIHVHIDASSDSVKLQISEYRSLQVLLYIGLLHCATELRDVIQTVILAKFAFLSALLRSPRAATLMPARMIFNEPAVLEDAYGRRLPIETDFVSSWEVSLPDNIRKDS